MKKEGSGKKTAPSISELLKTIERLKAEIIHHKKAEEELRLTSEIIRNMKEGVYLIKTVNGEIVYANPKFEELFGYELGEMIGKNVSIVNAPTDKSPEETAKEIMESLRDKGAWYGEVYNKKKDGTPFWCYASVSTFDHPKHGPVWVSIHQDITEQKNAKNERIRKNSLLAAINSTFEKALTGETLEDVAGACLSVAEGLTGSRFGFIGELNEKGLFDTLAITNPGWDECKVPESEAVKITKNMAIRGIDRSTMREGKSRIVNDIRGHPDSAGMPEGHPPITCFLGVPLQYGDRTIGMIALGNKDQGYSQSDQDDIESLASAFALILTHRKAELKIKELNEDLRHNLSHVEELNKELEGFSYSVSHDLRIPLRAIDGFSSRLVSDYADKLDDEGKRLLGVVIKSARRMGNLIDDILDFSRMGRKEISLSTIDMEHLAKLVFEDLISTAEKQAPEFIVNHMPVARADMALIRQVLLNLIGNAIKFTSAKEQPLIEIGGWEVENENVYYVKDNGAGFEMKYAHKLFGVFQRLHTETEFKGTGIGLATAKRVVERHGGRVWAEGEVGNGATFYFAIPKIHPPGNSP